jgi:hypothetical protein
VVNHIQIKNWFQEQQIEPTSYILITEDCTEKIDTLSQLLKRSKVKLPVQLKAMLAGRKQVRLKRSKVRLSVQLKAMLAGRKQVRLNSPFCTRNHTDASCFCLWAVSCISFHHACLLFKYQLRFVNGVVYK